MNENAHKVEYLVEQSTAELRDTNKQFGNEQRKQGKKLLLGVKQKRQHNPKCIYERCSKHPQLAER